MSEFCYVRSCNWCGKQITTKSYTLEIDPCVSSFSVICSDCLNYIRRRGKIIITKLKLNDNHTNNHTLEDGWQEILEETLKDTKSLYDQLNNMIKEDHYNIESSKNIINSIIINLEICKKILTCNIRGA